MAASDYLPDYVLRCSTCGLVYSLSRYVGEGSWHDGSGGDGAEVPIPHDEAVALVLKGAVSAGTCDTCYAKQVEGTVRMGDEA
jgi:hypothetical protein